MPFLARMRWNMVDWKGKANRVWSEVEDCVEKSPLNLLISASR